MMKTLTFDAKIHSWTRGLRYKPWSMTIKGFDDKGTDAQLKLESGFECPISPVSSDAKLRITVEVLESKTRVIPWKQEEVPLGCWLRHKQARNTLVSILALDNINIVLSGGTFKTKFDKSKVTALIGYNLEYVELANFYEYSIDNGKTWNPAGKVEEFYD